MKNDVLSRIDILWEMSGSHLNIETAKAELKENKNQMDELREELRFLLDNTDDKYFKISEKQVDENTKVGLETKIRRQEKAIQKLQDQIDKTVLDETNSHLKLEQLRNEIDSSRRYIAILKERFSSISDSSTKTYYQNILDTEEEKEKQLILSLKDEEKRYQDILDSLNIHNYAMEEMNEKLKNEKTKLADTKACLANPSSYIDEELKLKDENRVEELKGKIELLDARQLEIMTDPVMVADESKKLITEGQLEDGLAKVKELMTIVKAMPYMDIPSSSHLTKTLEDEEEKARDARDEFAMVIDSKEYKDSDHIVIVERIHYLNLLISSLEEKINHALEEIHKIDFEEFQELSTRLEKAISIYNQLNEEIANYKEMMEKENEDMTPKRKAVLAAAYQKKQQELSNVSLIIANYKENQKELIQKAYLLETQEIVKYKEEIAKHQAEIEEMNALKEKISEVKDILAIENDKKKLKELDDKVKSIKHRQKYELSPEEIYEEIQIYLGSMPNKEESSLEKEEESLFTFDTDVQFDAQELEEVMPVITDEALSNDPVSVFVTQPEEKGLETDKEDISLEEKANKEEETIPLFEEETKNSIFMDNSNNSYVIGDYEEDQSGNSLL